MAKRAVELQAVFLNIPYDNRFENLYLAYIVSVSAFGLIPRATLAIAGAARLDRIASFMESCPISLHDLSRVQLDRRPPYSTPRFNMPFELGLAVEWARTSRNHHWFVFEAEERRLHKALSDLGAYDPYVHGGTVDGVLREVSNAFVRPGVRQPNVPQLRKIYRHLRRDIPKILRRDIPKILRNAGSNSVFTARVFSDISLEAAALARAFNVLGP